MQLTFRELREKEIVNVVDGRKLGRVCDVVLCYPEYKWIGIVAPSSNSIFKREQVLIEQKNIVKIGEDVILVNLNAKPSGGGKPCCDPPPPPYPSPRRFDDFE